MRDQPGASQQTFGDRFGVTRSDVSMPATKRVDAQLLVRGPRGATNGLRLTLDADEPDTLHRLASTVLRHLPSG